MSSDKSIADWFKHEVYYWRLVHCTFSVVGIQLLVVVFVAFLLSCDLLHPIQGIIDGVRITFSFSFYGYAILLSALIVGLTLIHAYRYKVVPKVHTAVGSTLVSLVQPSSLTTILFYSATGGLLVRIYLGICGNSYSSLTVPLPVDSAQHRLNEVHLFLVLHGIFIGFLHGFGMIVGNFDCLIFPAIQRSKLTQIKSELLSRIRNAACCQARDAKWFLLFYAICGLSLQEWITQMLHLQNSDLSMISLLYNLLSVKVWWTWFLTGTALSFVLDVIAFVFAVFQTERIVFPIESPFDEESYRTLKYALGSTDIPLLRHLGFFDLSLAAQKSPSRLKIFFSISQPGGHPHHWNMVLKECLSLISSLTARLQEFSEPSAPIPAVAKPSQEGKLYSVQNANRSFDESGIRPLGTPKQSPTGGYPNRQSPALQAVNQELPAVLQTLPLVISSLKISFEKACCSISNVLLNLPAVAYFVKESTDVRIQNIFADCQCYIWALEALSFIVSLSYTEDKYGVVQRDMPEIMRTLLDAQQAINKIQKVDVPNTKRPVSSRFLSSKHCLSQSVRCNIKLAIYRISSVFKFDLRCLDLPPSYQKRLESYVHFQE